MPPAVAPDDDDPVIASYRVFLTKAGHTAETTAPSQSKLLLLQYPSHRPSSRPYNAANSQKPISLRVKPHTGLLELDIPILTNEHYNASAGSKFNRALQSSKVTQEGGTHGLAGGFNTTPSGLLPQSSLHDVPEHNGDLSPQEELKYQTLGGKIVSSASGDPVYLLGSFDHNGLHLSRLDALAQMRPQLHYIDATDELDRKRTSLASTAALGRTKSSLDQAQPRLETKAIDVKVKDAKDDGRDRGMNSNARLLREIQAEQWQPHDWVDESDEVSLARFEERLHLSFPVDDDGAPDPNRLPKLRSKITNSEWLDRMSAPRETGHGKKGLLAKLRGRERERARRKKNEEEKARQAQATAQGGLQQDAPSEESEMSAVSESETSEIDLTGGDEGVKIKQEAAPMSPEPTKKKRGRPKKNDTMVVDD